MLPDFETREVWPEKERKPYKVLPPDVYPCTELELHERFVAGFPDSVSRDGIFEGFSRFRREACALNFSVTQWVDGTFISSKTDPDDIDVVNFVDYDFLNEMDDEQDEFSVLILDGHETTKASYHTHAFLVPACEPDHPYFPVYEADRLYWLNWWGKSRPIRTTGERVPKGFLRMVIGNLDDCPVVNVV